jgi:hypothetical protein
VSCHELGNPPSAHILDCVFASPLTGRSLVLGAIVLVDVSDLRDKRVVRVGICQHRADRQENFRDGQGRAPLVSKDVEADAAVGVDVGVVDASGEVDLRGLEGVVGREMNCEEEDTTRVWRVAGSHDCSLPVEQILTDGTCGA